MGPGECFFGCGFYDGELSVLDLLLPDELIIMISLHVFAEQSRGREEDVPDLKNRILESASFPGHFSVFLEEIAVLLFEFAFARELKIIEIGIFLFSLWPS